MSKEFKKAHQQAIDKLQSIRTQLQVAFAERDGITDGMLACMVAREHILLLGPPGTAKSALAEAICDAFGGQYFRWLLTKFTTPDEIFGPVSLSALENDKYERITTGKLPEADVALLDEIFKASSAILNAMLTIINEREFHNNGGSVEVPLRTVVGASNEMPESEAELGALYDRFIYRFWVDGIRDRDSLLNVLNGTASASFKGEPMTEIERSSIDKLYDSVIVPEALYQTCLDLKLELEKEGFRHGDRRWYKIMQMVPAVALVRSTDASRPIEATDEDLAEVAVNALWNKPEERSKLRKVVYKVINPIGVQVEEIIEAAHEIIKMLPSEPDALLAQGAAVNRQLKDMVKKLRSLGADKKVVNEGIDEIGKLGAKFKEQLLGVMG